MIVSFKDGITFEVVPVFNNNAGSYTFPDSNDGGKWRTTNPKPEIRAIRDRNASCNGNLVRLCRMMRSWKQEGSVRIGGLLVDTLGYQFILDWEFNVGHNGRPSHSFPIRPVPSGHFLGLGRRGGRVVSNWVGQAEPWTAPANSETPFPPYWSLRTDTRASGPHLQVWRTQAPSSREGKTWKW